VAGQHILFELFAFWYTSFHWQCPCICAVVVLQSRMLPAIWAHINLDLKVVLALFTCKMSAGSLNTNSDAYLTSFRRVRGASEASNLLGAWGLEKLSLRGW